MSEKPCANETTGTRSCRYPAADHAYPNERVHAVARENSGVTEEEQIIFEISIIGQEENRGQTSDLRKCAVLSVLFLYNIP